MELQILHGIQEIRNEWLDALMELLSALGDGGVFWIVLALILIILPRTRKCGVSILLSMALTHLIGNMFLKNLIARPRPCHVDTSVEMLISCPASFSFPSGHTANGFAAAVSIFLNYRKPGVAALVLAASIAFSRMYLFVHYPTDILGGFVLGTMDACLIAWCIRLWSKKRATGAKTM